MLSRVIVADTLVNVAEVIVQRRQIAYFRAGQGSSTRPVGEAQE
jgi:hypothetical protein